MDFDVPTDLINKAQIGFREAAGLSSFDRKDTTLPSISTIEAYISASDPSPSYLRCKFCQGRLLRGLQSLICIYCGEYQKKDLNPDPISFNSTHGYSWLLQSLNFNGSERIGSLAEGSGINGGQSPAEDELTLSELLDLKISWHDEPKKSENNFNIKTSEHNGSLNLGTTDFDHFFSKSKSKSAIVSDVPQEHPVATKNDQNKAFEATDFDFFTESKRVIVSNVPEEQPVASKADQNITFEGQENLASDWNAEFQFSDSKMENEKPQSVDPFVDPEADLSAHLDVVSLQKENFDFEKPNDDSDPFQDDFFGNMDSVIQPKDGLSGDLNDFNLKTVDGEWFSDGNWQKSSVKNTLNDRSLQDNPNDSLTDWFENTNWQKSSASNTDIIKDDNMFDIKPQIDPVSFQSEKSARDSSDKHHSDVTNVVANDDDGFDEWNDFTSSTGNQESFQEFWKESSNEKVGISEKISEVNLFQSTDDSQDVDFGNFLQSDIFSGDKNPNNNQEGYDIFSEVSTASRNANAGAGNNAEGSKNDEFTPNATTSPNNDVQMLMSQMHDLSFMLKTELSIPTKPDDAGPSHS